jgi:hypothetical protein
MVSAMRKNIGLVMLMCVCFIVMVLVPSTGILAQNITATPIRVIIATSTTIATQVAIETFTPTPTETELGLAQLQVKATTGEANVRSEPDPASQQLGVIQTGISYVVRGRYFSWYLFDFPSSPTGTGWVYGELVDIIGDPLTIPDIDPYAIPTNAADAQATQTAVLVLQTPGGDLTITAESRILVIDTPIVDTSALQQSNEILPTYTPPAEYNPRITATSVLDGQQGTILTALNTVSSQGIPPILPIIGLAGLGILGVIVSTLRR